MIFPDPTALRDSRFFEDLQGKIEEHLQKSPDVQLKAFWDFDGTILNGDISEGKRTGSQIHYRGMIDRSILEGIVPNHEASLEGVEKFWAKYSVDAEAGYHGTFYLGQVYADLPLDVQTRIRSLSVKVYEEVSTYFFAFSLELINFLNSKGVHSHVISASPELFLKEVCSFLPIPMDRISGVNLDKERGRRVDPIFNYGDGKKDRMDHILRQSPKKAQPILAIGNSWTVDGPMIRAACQTGGLGLLVNAGLAGADYQHKHFYRLNIA
ncbi:MAG: haloacid dehalogenase-like hydrolase [Oligoflexales bacterium]|nr:haloacid dehalogenase-like hydrolase [Oligoflexales bacterium]